MPNILGDGTVIGSQYAQEDSVPFLDRARNNHKLMFGHVTEIHYPDSANSHSKAYMEYDVYVTEAENNSINGHTYPRCRMADMFGGVNDHITFSYRSDKRDDTKVSKGSLVILLCLNGAAIGPGSAVIIGGMSHPKAAKKPAKQDGHFYDFSFNGLSQSIDKDGAFTIKFDSAISLDGKKANEKAAGTEIKITKDGHVKILDNEGQYIEMSRTDKKITITNGSEKVVLDKGSKDIKIESGGKLSEKSTDAMNIESGAALSAKSGADMNIESGGNLALQISSNGMIKAGSNFQLQSGGPLMLQSGGPLVISGGSMVTISGAIVALGNASTQAAGVGISMCMGIGNLGIPVYSQIVSGSATTFIGS